MCIACELELFLALDQPPPGAATREPDTRFACDVPQNAPQQDEPPKSSMDERKP
jgi:hypothetical protein